MIKACVGCGRNFEPYYQREEYCEDCQCHGIDYECETCHEMITVNTAKHRRYRKNANHRWRCRSCASFRPKSIEGFIRVEEWRDGMAGYSNLSPESQQLIKDNLNDIVMAFNYGKNHYGEIRTKKITFHIPETLYYILGIGQVHLNDIIFKQAINESLDFDSMDLIALGDFCRNRLRITEHRVGDIEQTLALFHEGE